MQLEKIIQIIERNPKAAAELICSLITLLDEVREHLSNIPEVWCPACEAAGVEQQDRGCLETSETYDIAKKVSDMEHQVQVSVDLGRL